MLFVPSGKGRKRQEKGEKGRFRPISGNGGQTPLKPPFVTPPFAAAPFVKRVEVHSLTIEEMLPGVEELTRSSLKGFLNRALLVIKKWAFCKQFLLLGKGCL